MLVLVVLISNFLLVPSVCKGTLQENSPILSCTGILVPSPAVQLPVAKLLPPMLPLSGASSVVEPPPLVQTPPPVLPQPCASSCCCRVPLAAGGAGYLVQALLHIYAIYLASANMAASDSAIWLGPAAGLVYMLALLITTLALVGRAPLPTAQCA